MHGLYDLRSFGLDVAKNIESNVTNAARTLSTHAVCCSWPWSSMRLVRAPTRPSRR